MTHIRHTHSPDQRPHVDNREDRIGNEEQQVDVSRQTTDDIRIHNSDFDSRCIHTDRSCFGGDDGTDLLDNYCGGVHRGRDAQRRQIHSAKTKDQLRPLS